MRTALALLALAPGIQAKEDIGSILGVGHKHGHNHSMARAGGIGSGHLESVYTAYLPLPASEAELRSQGWTKQSSSCDNYMGYPWTYSSSGPTKTHPLILYTTKWGAMSGMATIVRDPGMGFGPYQPVLSKQYKKWTSKNRLQCSDCGDSNKYFQLTIAFRDKYDSCKSSPTDSMAFGDRLVLNPHGGWGKSRMDIPVTESGAASKGWEKGACFDGMGTHWFYDTSGSQTWAPETLLPIVAMYHKGKINAVFFNSPAAQASAPPAFGPYDRKQANGWESFPLPPPMMCANACSLTCEKKLIGPAAAPFGSVWSTQHIYFNEAKTVTCDADMWCGSDRIDGKPRNPVFIIPYRGNCCPREFWETFPSSSSKTLVLGAKEVENTTTSAPAFNPSTTSGVRQMSLAIAAVFMSCLSVFAA